MEQNRHSAFGKLWLADEWLGIILHRVGPTGWGKENLDCCDHDPALLIQHCRIAFIWWIAIFEVVRVGKKYLIIRKLCNSLGHLYILPACRRPDHPAQTGPSLLALHQSLYFLFFQVRSRIDLPLWKQNKHNASVQCLKCFPNYVRIQCKIQLLFSHTDGFVWRKVINLIQLGIRKYSTKCRNRYMLGTDSTTLLIHLLKFSYSPHDDFEQADKDNEPCPWKQCRLNLIKVSSWKNK